MSEPKMKIPFEQMAFYFEASIDKAMQELFNESNQHGWTKEEFDKTYYEEAIQNAFEQRERNLH